MSKLKFGWAERSITPDKKVSLAGQFAERISEYVEKPICVTALAISSETDQAIFCACDLVDISWGLRDAVRAKLAGNDAGLDPMKVIISATHVHTGPRYAHRDDSSSKFTGNATSFRALIEVYRECQHFRQPRHRAARGDLRVPRRTDQQGRAGGLDLPHRGQLCQCLRPRAGRHVPPRVL